MIPNPQYVDVEALDNAIDKSGLKVGFICEQMGISRQSFDKKRKGKVPFRGSEVFVLCSLFGISNPDDKTKIFCPKG